MAAALELSMVEVGGQPLRVGRWPGRPGGAPLLVFNGIGANIELLEPFVAALEGVEVLAFDVPGTGGSPLPALPYRFSTLARLAARLLDALGYRRGGRARRFVGRRARAAVRPPVPGSLPPPGPRRDLRRRAHGARPAVRHGQAAEPAPVPGPRLPAGDRRRALRRRATAAIPTCCGRTADRSGRRAASATPTSSSRHGAGRARFWLRTLPQPALVMHGNDDPIVPLVNAKLLAALIRDARLHVVDDGHLFMLTRATEVAPVVRGFLDAERA